MPALLNEAEQALALVSTTADAEVLWRKLKAIDHVARLAQAHAELRLRAGRLHLRAQRKWGELLGPAENTGVPVADGNRLSAADKSARHKARQVYEVPEPVFEDYLGKVRDPEMLRRARLLRLAKDKKPPTKRKALATWSLYRGAIRDAEIEAESVDLLLTDPPYPLEFVSVYRDVAELGLHALRPGGMVAAMAGQSYLPHVLDALRIDGLEYRWTLAYLTPGGQAVQLWDRHVNTFWKPILCFSKGAHSERWFGDVAKSAVNDNDKRFHEWGQSESGLADLVKRLSEPGDTILDPCMGGGSTAIAAVAEGRDFIGGDSNVEKMDEAEQRLRATFGKKA